MAKQILDNIELFPIQEKMLEVMESDSVDRKPFPIMESTSENIHRLIALWEHGIFSREELIECMPSVFTPPEEQEGYTSDEIMGAEMIYAPYIPLYQTPTVQLSDIKGARFYTGWKQTSYKIPKYNDIYSDISKRFELLDL